MKKLLSIALSALLLLSACIIPVSAAEKDLVADYFPHGLETPQAPYIKVTSDDAAGENTELQFYCYKTTELQNLALDIKRLGEKFNEDYGIGYIDTFIQIDAKFNNGSWLSSNGTWNTMDEYGEIFYGENISDYNYAFKLTEDSGEDDAAKLMSFCQANLYHYNGEDDEYDAYLTPYVSIIPNEYDGQKCFDFSELTITYRFRWCLKSLVDDYTEDRNEFLMVSDWSDEVSIGKNGSQAEPAMPERLDAPVLSDFSLEINDDNTVRGGECFVEIPDSIYQAAFYYNTVLDERDSYALDFEMQINNGEWIKGNTANSLWLINGYRSVAPDDGDVEIEPDDDVNLRLRFINLHDETEVSPWSNVVGTNPDVIEHEHLLDWEYNEETHWQECSCGYETEPEPHDFDGNYCIVCGYDKGVYCPHDGERTYTYASDGYHTVVCNKCNEKLGEEACSGGEVACLQPCICEYCNTQYCDSLEHYYLGYENDKEQHWQVCTRCEEATKAEDHIYSDSYFCDVCGYDSTPPCEHKETRIIYNKNGTHSEKCIKCSEIFSTEKCYGGEATCVANGKCKVCGGLYLEKLGHNYGSVEYNAKEHWSKCIRCDATKPKSAHNFKLESVITQASFANDGKEMHKCAGCEARKEVKVSRYLYGDVNCDGSVLAADARLCLRAAVGLERYEKGSRQEIACNVDGKGEDDSTITAADARLVLRYAVGLDTSFPIEAM